MSYAVSRKNSGRATRLVTGLGWKPSELKGLESSNLLLFRHYDQVPFCVTITAQENYKTNVIVRNCRFDGLFTVVPPSSTTPTPIFDLSNMDIPGITELKIIDEDMTPKSSFDSDKLKKLLHGMTGSVRIGSCRKCGCIAVYKREWSKQPTHDFVECIMSR